MVKEDAYAHVIKSEMLRASRLADRTVYGEYMYEEWRRV